MKARKRSEIDKAYQWSIDDMFTPESYARTYQNVEAALPSVQAYKGKLSTDGDVLIDLLQARDDLSKQLAELFTYARMKLDEDNKSSESQNRLQRVGDLEVKVSSALAFIEPEMIALDADALIAKVTSDARFADYDHYIENLVRGQAHYLASDKEALLAELLDIQRAPQQIFSMLTNADFTFKDIDLPDGRQVPLNAGNYIMYLMHADRTVREQAFTHIHSAYKDHINAIAASYTASVKKDTALARIRQFESSLAMSLFEDNIGIDVYNHLVSAAVDRLDLYQRYLTIRRHELALDKLHPYDLYVPIVGDVNMTIPFDKGFSMVKEALKPLGDDYIAVLDKVLDERWIDVYTTEGKSAGAYSWGTYQSKPFILLNYNDTLSDVTTLAHELGHSMHSHYSIANQPHSKYGYSLFVAEVASTVNETLMMQYLIANANNRAEKLYLLNQLMEVFRTTFFRQTMFAEFERHVHASYESGQPLSADDLSAYYLTLNQKYFGDGVVIDELLQYEWSRIPHFYRSFYVYSYATGLSAAISISQRILNGDQAVLAGYKAFLSAGGSVYPLDALKLTGVDMTQPQTYYDALDFFGSILDQFEATLNT